MKMLHFGIICGIFIVLMFTVNTALMQKPDLSIQSISNTTMSKDLTIRLGGNTTGVYYPMYSLNELPQVLAAKKAFPIVPFNVNINPASGPGTEPSGAITTAITQLKSAGA